MDHQPFSVAISVYKSDNAIFFDRALESITELQTIVPDEIVLVVDGPVGDDINQVVDKYSQKYHFKVIRLEQNGGLGNALKIATENCSNELIARMDSDDVATNNRFEQQLEAFKNNPNLDIVGGDISEFIVEEKNIVSHRVVPSSDKDIKGAIKKTCPFNHMTVMFKKTALMKAGGYLEWHYNEDYYLWIRMYLSGAIFANTGTTLVNVRTGKDQYKRRGGIKYYKSEKGIQKLLLESGIIKKSLYRKNVLKRFIVQVLTPSFLRGFIYKKFARKK